MFSYSQIYRVFISSFTHVTKFKFSQFCENATTSEYLFQEEEFLDQFSLKKLLHQYDIMTFGKKPIGQIHDDMFQLGYFQEDGATRNTTKQQSTI